MHHLLEAGERVGGDGDQREERWQSPGRMLRADLGLRRHLGLAAEDPELACQVLQGVASVPHLQHPPHPFLCLGGLSLAPFSSW